MKKFLLAAAAVMALVGHAEASQPDRTEENAIPFGVQGQWCFDKIQSKKLKASAWKRASHCASGNYLHFGNDRMNAEEESCDVMNVETTWRGKNGSPKTPVFTISPKCKGKVETCIEGLTFNRELKIKYTSDDFLVTEFGPATYR